MFAVPFLLYSVSYRGVINPDIVVDMRHRRALRATMPPCGDAVQGLMLGQREFRKSVHLKDNTSNDNSPRDGSGAVMLTSCQQDAGFIIRSDVPRAERLMVPAERSSPLLHMCDSLMTPTVIIMIIVFIAIVQRPQEVLEGLAGHLSALLTRRFVRKTEVDTLVDTGVDHFVGHLREAAIRARVLHGRTRVGGRH
jgi:hypothetical protein